MDRELTSNELALLAWMLAGPEVPGGDALREQIPHTRVVSGVPNMPTWLHMSVSGAPRADCPSGVFPTDAIVVSSSGEATGFILLWTEDGYLSALEHAWVTDDMPEEFPAVEQLRLWDGGSP